METKTILRQREKNCFCKETLTYMAIQEKITNISYAPTATLIKPCMTNNITYFLGTMDYFLIILHNKNKNILHLGLRNLPLEKAPLFTIYCVQINLYILQSKVMLFK